MAAVFFFLLLTGIPAGRGRAVATSLAVTAAVKPGFDFRGDTHGVRFSFTVKNTGTNGSFRSVRLTRPSDQWTVLGCPGGPTGWTAARTTTMCDYRAPTGGGLGAGASATFLVTAGTVAGSVNQTAAWSVKADQDGVFDGGTNSVAAPATGLAATIYVWRVTRAGSCGRRSCRAVSRLRHVLTLGQYRVHLEGGG